jgi:hypothetical protein
MGTRRPATGRVGRPQQAGLQRVLALRVLASSPEESWPCSLCFLPVLGPRDQWCVHALPGGSDDPAPPHACGLSKTTLRARPCLVLEGTASRSRALQLHTASGVLRLPLQAFKGRLPLCRARAMECLNGPCIRLHSRSLHPPLSGRINCLP